MIKVHKLKWGYRDPEKVFHEYDIVVYYIPGEELPGLRFVINVPEEIALATGRKKATGETMEKAREQLNSIKEDYMSIIAPKTKTKIVRYSIRFKTGNAYYGDESISLSLEHRTLWMVQQSGRDYKLDEEFSDGQLKRLNIYFDPESDKNWMPWTQTREDWFKQFEKNIGDLAKQFEIFYETTFPKDSDDFGKAIDSGSLLPPFENTKNLLISRKE